MCYPRLVLKSTLRYWYEDRLPGELYLDYYTISGLAGGFKQHFLYEKDLKAYLYLYGQENRTDLPGLFNWRGELSIDNNKSQWKTDTLIKYINYDDYSYTNGRINLNNRVNTWTLDLRSYFTSRDYYESDKNDRKDLDFDLNFDKKFPDNWRYHLDLYRDYRYNPEEGLKQRWGGSTYGPESGQAGLQGYPGEGPRPLRKQRRKTRSVITVYRSFPLTIIPPGPGL